MERLDRLLENRAAQQQTLDILVTNENYLRRSLKDVNDALDDQNAELSNLSETLQQTKTAFLNSEKEKRAKLLNKEGFLEIIEKEEKKTAVYKEIAEESRALKKQMARELEKKKELEKKVADQRAIRRVLRSKCRTIEREEQAFWMEISKKVKWMAENGYALEEPRFDAESGLQDPPQPSLEGDKNASEDEDEKDKELQAAREDQHDCTFEKGKSVRGEETTGNPQEVKPVSEDIAKAAEKSPDKLAESSINEEAKGEGLVEKNEGGGKGKEDHEGNEESSNKECSESSSKGDVPLQLSESSPVKTKSQKKEDEKKRKKELKQKKEQAKREKKAMKEKQKLEKRQKKKSETATENKTNELISVPQIQDSSQLDQPGSAWSVKSTNSNESEVIPATTITVKADVPQPINNNKPGRVRTTIRPSKEKIQAQLAKNKEQQKLAEQINHSECKEVEDGAANKDEEEARQSDAEDVKDIEEYLEKYAVHEFQLDRKDEECTEKRGCFSFLNNIFGRSKLNVKRSFKLKIFQKRRRAVVTWNDKCTCQVPTELIMGEYMMAHQARV